MNKNYFLYYNIYNDPYYGQRAIKRICK
ncbi:hypothetical protein ACQ27_gp110 [Klebsiella phage K64-1]|nr:hypothetical protein ACQ27_gp110 [Klebsiella phage K64-1]